MLTGRRPRRRRMIWALIAFVVVGVASGCGARTEGRWSAPGSPSRQGESGSAGVVLPGAGAGTAPASDFGVGLRRLALGRGPDRPLPTVVWYPAPGAAGGETARTGAPIAEGRFPLLLFSHGLMARPETHARLMVRLAAAGFVVAAPAYPHTNGDAARFDLTDVRHQPEDGLFVVESLLRLGETDGDLFSNRLDPARVAVAGHSAGGYTTAGMLASQRDPRLVAAIVIAGGAMGSFVEPRAEVLFVHGDADQTVAYSAGRSAYDRLPWPKAFLTVLRGDHGRYLTPTGPGFAPVLATITDFLRATLYGDHSARERLTSDGASAGTRFERAGV